MVKKDMSKAKKKGCHKGKGGHGVKGQHRNGARQGREGHDKRGRGRHHGGRHHIKWCLILAAGLYAALILTFAGIFAKFVRVFRRYHTLNEMHIKSVNMRVEERNRMYQEHREASRKCRRAMWRQVTRQQQQEPVRQPCSFVPPCVAPSMDGALRQSQVVCEEENRPNQLTTQLKFQSWPQSLKKPPIPLP